MVCVCLTFLLDKCADSHFFVTLVLTRVVVYAGIGIISTVMVPAMFEALEWGV